MRRSPEAFPREALPPEMPGPDEQASLPCELPSHCPGLMLLVMGLPAAAGPEQNLQNWWEIKPN